MHLTKLKILTEKSARFGVYCEQTDGRGGGLFQNIFIFFLYGLVYLLLWDFKISTGWILTYIHRFSAFVKNIPVPINSHLTNIFG